MGRLSAVSGERVPSRRHDSEGKETGSIAVDAARPPGDCSPEKMATGHASGSGQPKASGLLSGRVYVPVQSAEIHESRQAFLPPRAASGSYRTCNLGSDTSPPAQGHSETTIC